MLHLRYSGLVILAFAVLAAAACSSNFQMTGPPPVILSNIGPTGLHVAGTSIVDGNGNQVVLHGVDRSGTEYLCVSGPSVFDGPADATSVAAIASWKNVNAVRIPLNESCWLGINGAVASGTSYINAIKNYVYLLHGYGLVPILDLHWVGPGTMLANKQYPMPDASHAADFWTKVAQQFAGDSGVIFDLYNEPFPDSNMDSDAGWQCWLQGCNANIPANGQGMMSPGTYPAAGMQALVDAVRSAEGNGYHHLLVLGGLQYSNALTQWLTHEPSDPAGNLAASWHIYNYNGCRSASCWNGAPAQVAAAVPLVATEIGESDCAGTFITLLMQWLDGHGAGYLAWSWNAYGACNPARNGSPYSLITDYASGNPEGASTVTGMNATYAQTFRDHLATLPIAAPPTDAGADGP